MKDYWERYDATLARIVNEKPHTMEALKLILDAFEPPSSGVAFFPGGADETLADALSWADWRVEFREGDYVWVAKSPTGELITYVEGDVYEGDVAR